MLRGLANTTLPPVRNHPCQARLQRRVLRGHAGVSNDASSVLPLHCPWTCCRWPNTVRAGPAGVQKHACVATTPCPDVFKSVGESLAPW